MKNWLRVFFVFYMLGLMVYANSLNNKFLIDDFAFLNDPLMNQTKYIFNQWNPYREQALGVLDNQENLRYYRPMAHMVLNFSYTTFKNNYWQYHLLNLFLFVIASTLIYVLIDKLTGNCNLAFLTGLLYLIHPINGIVVNYISASVFAFQVIFMLATILLLLGSLERRSNRMCYVLSLVCCFLSLFWHESGILTPFYVAVVIFLFRKDPFKTKINYLLPYFLIIISYVVFRTLFFGIKENVFKQITLFHMTGWEYLATLFRVYSWYLSKLFYLQGIVMQWDTPVWHEHIIPNVLGLFLLIVICLVLFIKFSKEKICQLGLIWMLIGFATLCLAAFRAPDNGAMIEPHWFIFSSIGFFILAAYCCLQLMERMREVGIAVLFIIIFVLGSVSYAYNQLWSDPKTYTLYWSKQAPDLTLTYVCLGYAYEREGYLEASKKYFKIAIAKHTTNVDAYIDLAAVEQVQGDLKDAERDNKKALKINPFSADAYYNLGSIYYIQGHLDMAVPYYDRARMLNPLFLKPRVELASIYLKHAEYQKAIKLCKENLAIEPNDPQTLSLLRDIYKKMNGLAH